MNENPINWRATLLEAFFLVLGVVLALAAGDWLENQNNKKRAATALVSIIEELNANHQSVSVAINYHSQLLDTLYKYMQQHIQESESFPDANVFPKGFVNPASPLSRAWEAASATGIIEYMPYEDVLLISQVYMSQERYEAQSLSIGQQIYGRMFEEGTMGILRNYRNLTEIIGALVYTECSLATEYARVIPELLQDSTSVSIPQFCQYIPKR